jgi:transcriptional regulator with PAS, ATPase and Fis domain
MEEQIQAIKQRFGIIGQSQGLMRALSTAMRVAGTDLSVIIYGESGVGKEVFSKIIHNLSPRKHNGFIAINCGAIPEGIINSELFGHEKGAFTGASGERKGYFETYDGGTIFLDEIGEMPLDTQAFLLRVLESGEFIRVGSSKIQHTDVRIIAATNVDLQEKIQKGKFREDLFYRLNTVPIHVPPLRERTEDIYILFRKFARDFADNYRNEPIRLTEDGRQLLESYSWPGNIRELKNVTEQLSIMSEKPLLDAQSMIRCVPQLGQRHLPMIPHQSEDGGGISMQEREILYQLLFDMKKDLNDLKSVVSELILNNDLRLQNPGQLLGLGEGDKRSSSPVDSRSFGRGGEHPTEVDRSDLPILLREEEEEDYSESEIVEENLSLEANEKDLIVKALRKHDGRRKEAAEDLGISERTLYRKIKQYQL